MDRRIVQAALEDEDPLVVIRELVPFAAACGMVGTMIPRLAPGPRSRPNTSTRPARKRPTRT